jgi:hypothetical protein
MDITFGVETCFYFLGQSITNSKTVLVFTTNQIFILDLMGGDPALPGLKYGFPVSVPVPHSRLFPAFKIRLFLILKHLTRGQPPRGPPDYPQKV